jgi:hypothetical protein
VGRRLTTGRRTAKAFPACGQEATFRIFKVEYLKGGGVPQHRVTFELFSPSDGEYIASYFAFISARLEIHRVYRNLIVALAGCGISIYLIVTRRRSRGFEISEIHKPPPIRLSASRSGSSIYEGNFNVRVRELLDKYPIRPQEATFCLLDQRTFECRWATVKAVAEHKKMGNKIELFYFLPIFWLGRALAAQKDTAVLTAWWGRSDWHALRRLAPFERAEAFMRRFKEELGYWSVLPYAIYSRKTGGRVCTT